MTVKYIIFTGFEPSLADLKEEGSGEQNNQGYFDNVRNGTGLSEITYGNNINFDENSDDISPEVVESTYEIEEPHPIVESIETTELKDEPESNFSKCSVHKVFENGERLCSDDIGGVNSKCFFVCDEGRTLLGSAIIKCVLSGNSSIAQWNKPWPTCIKSE